MTKTHVSILTGLALAVLLVLLVVGHGCGCAIPGVDQGERDTRQHAVGQAAATNSIP